jgi:DNA-binding transcriptional regulator YdaS (Cro superfamily)
MADTDGMARIRQHRGLISKVARELGISRGAVAMWRQVPSEHLGAVAGITGISAAELRPDLARLFHADADKAA